MLHFIITVMLPEIERLAQSYYKPQYTVAYIEFLRNIFNPNDKIHVRQTHKSVRYSWEDVKNYICVKTIKMLWNSNDLDDPYRDCINEMLIEKQKLMKSINSQYKKAGSCFIDLSNCGWSVVKLPG